MKPNHLAVRLLEWGFDALLLIYPKPFRERFGREMRMAFSAEAADVHRSAGAMALVPFFIRIIIDSLVSSGREYLDMPQRLLAIAMVLVLVPVDWLTFHDVFEPHTVRDYLTLAASILVFAHIAVDFHHRRIAAR
ncbi:hypothetical protein [Dyella subtropica]|uniref:hypothetical protein n=1 Tax=Dyella subtropica TaxID=2992127 RepID=UPI002256CEAD|nr:hypothetical protein [Dyella subtropica]